MKFWNVVGTHCNFQRSYPTVYIMFHSKNRTQSKIVPNDGYK